MTIMGKYGNIWKMDNHRKILDNHGKHMSKGTLMGSNGEIWEIYGQHMVKEMLGVPLYRSLAGIFH